MYGSTTKGDVVKRSDCILDAWKIQQSQKQRNWQTNAPDMPICMTMPIIGQYPIADPIIGATLPESTITTDILKSGYIGTFNTQLWQNNSWQNVEIED